LNAMNEEESRLESAIAEVYGGPLEDFVRRRDSLAKELRSAGDRESASRVKGLRKPSRTAWALNLGAREAIEPLVAAVAGTLEAQAGGGDVRAATATLRSAVREFASEAARAAQRAGHRIEPGALANPVLAVLGRPDSFNELRGGYLVEIPEAGGLDLLATLPTPSGSPLAPVIRREPPAADSPQPAVLESARAAALQAASALADVRVHAEDAQRALRDAESKVHAAEERVRQAGEEERAARKLCDRAREDAVSAAARLLKAESAAAEAERRLEGASRNRNK
jgi:hypothetical protein